MEANRLLELNLKVKNGRASKMEKDEYMQELFARNSITKKQYSDYKQGRNSEDILDAALAIGGIVLLGYLIGELLN